MADDPVLLSDVLAHLAETFDLEIRSQINRSSRFLQWVPIRPYAGEQVDWRVIGDGRTVTKIASGGDAPDATTDLRAKATLDYGRYASTLIIADDALTAAMANPVKAVNLFRDEIRAAVRKITREMNDDLFDGTGANSIIGLETAVDSTGVYAGLDQATANLNWQSTEVGTGVAAITAALMKQTSRGLFNAFGADLNPEEDRIFMPADVYDTYTGLAEANLRLNVGERTGMKVDVAAGSASFQDIPIVREVSNPADTVFFLRQESVELRYMPFVDPVSGMTVTRAVAGDTNEESEVPVMVHLKVLGPTGAATKIMVTIQVQLCVLDRFAHGKLLVTA